MLLRFSFENLFSFLDKQEITFDHEYNNASIFLNNSIFEYKENKKKRTVLNGAIIFGANAAGKSNITYALNQMRKYYLDSINFNKKSDLTIRIKEFLFLESNNFPITFSVEFMEKIEMDYYKIKYTFSINHQNNIIEHEVLSYQKVLKTTLSSEIIIFERAMDSIIHSCKEIHKMLSKIKQENIKHKLVLSLLNFDINETFFKDEISTLPFKLIEACGTSIEKKMVFSDDTNSMDEFIQMIDLNPLFKEYIIASLYKFDFAVTDFELQDISEDFVNSLLNNSILKNIDEDEKQRLLNIKRYKVNTIHNVDAKNYKLPLSAESSGTKKFLSHSLNLYESILMEKVYISDEFDSHYHFHIQEGIIKTFLYPETPSETQFLLITHNPLLLNSRFFSKEQVYFVEKDREKQTSQVFSLKDFEKISYNNHNWVNLYLTGRVGAVPEVFD